MSQMSNEPVFDIGLADKFVSPDDSSLNDRSSDRSGMVLGAAALLVAVAALVALTVFSGSNDEPDPGGASVVQPQTDDAATGVDAQPDTGAAGDRLVVDERESAPADRRGGIPPSSAHLNDESVAGLFTDVIDTDATNYAVAYVSDEQFVMLDHRGVTPLELEIAQDFATVANYSLLAFGGRTWALNPRSPDVGYLVSNNYTVVNSASPGTIAVLTSTPTSIGLMTAGLPIPNVVLPTGAEFIAIQRRGVLVTPRTGGTYAVTGQASSLVKINDGRAVAASVGATIYEDCDESLKCRYELETVSSDSLLSDGSLNSDPVRLPVDAGSDFSVSPDGAWVLARIDNMWSLYPGTGGERTLAGVTAGESAPAWAPDSSFVAIARGQSLQLLYPETGQLVDLTALGEIDALLVVGTTN